METSEYKNIYESEEEHFYYRSVHDLILTLCSKFLPEREHLQILDAGCGTGGLALKLQKFGTVSAVDMHEEALKFSRLRGVDSVEGSVENLPFEDNRFDLVTSVDVIYHKAVKDDVEALRQFARVLKSQGLLIMRVPARPELFSSHDQLVWTERRYKRRELTKKLNAAGLKPLQVSYCHSPLYLPALAKTSLEKLTGTKPHSGVSETSGLVNEICTNVLKIESKLLSMGVAMPIGLGLMAVARKA